MAIQGDGSGFINIPEATATGDFSIVFDGVEITNPTSFAMFAGHSTNATFLAIEDVTTVAGRVAGWNIGSSGYAGTLGEVVKVEYSRVGDGAGAAINTFLHVNDVLIASTSKVTNVLLDKFFAYLSGSLEYNGKLSGFITMTGFGPTRTYTTDGTPGDTTLVDTTSGLNGTFTGFTTGGFLPASSGIEITSIKDNHFKLADINGNATFTVTGTTGVTTAIEYSINGGTNWQILDGTPDGVNFSGDVVVNGTVDIAVRIAANTGITHTVTGVSATQYNILFWGQSNEVSRNANLNTIVVGGGNPLPSKYLPESGLFGVASDPTGMGGGTIGGSTASWIAQKYSDIGILVGIVNVAEGGTALAQWQKGDVAGYYARISSAASAVGGVSFTTCIIGETDAGNGTSEADAITRMTSICSDINTDFGAETYISYFVNSAASGTPENILKIRNAYDSVIANNVFVKHGGDTGTIDTSGGIHMTTVPQFSELSQLRFDAQLVGLGLVVPQGIVTIGSITVGETTASIPFTYNDTDETGYEYRLDGGTATSVTSPISLTGLTAETAYTIEVRAINTSGSGAWSTLANFTTDATTSTLNLTVTGIPDGSFMTVLDDEAGTRITRQNETYSSGALSITLPVIAGTRLKGYVDDASNPSANGAYLEGVTV